MGWRLRSHDLPLRAPVLVVDTAALQTMRWMPPRSSSCGCAPVPDLNAYHPLFFGMDVLLYRKCASCLGSFTEEPPLLYRDAVSSQNSSRKWSSALGVDLDGVVYRTKSA